MRCAVVTFSLAPNFGAFLQAAATNFHLKAQGASVVNFDPNSLSHYTHKKLRPQALVYRLQARAYRRDRERIGLAPISAGSLTLSNDEKLDAIFVGSDQVLNPNCVEGGDLQNVLLPCWAGTPRFGLALSAYSARDLDEAPRNVTRELAKFSGLSFREPSIAAWAKDRLSIDGPTLPDPSFLLSKERMLRLAELDQTAVAPRDAIVAGYDLDAWAKLLISELPGFKRVRYINYSFRAAHQFGLYIGGALRAINEVQNSKAVITNSFHFAIAGLLLGKEVYLPAHGPNDGGDRLRNLANRVEFDNFKSNILKFSPSMEGARRVDGFRREVEQYIDDCIAKSQLLSGS